MNVKAIWLPLALMAVTPTSNADAGTPTSVMPTTTAPDLCAKLDRFGDPALCEAVGPGMAPWWDSEVCCVDGRNCTEAKSTGCATGADLFWCESAVLYSDGTLDCVYEVPSYCEVYPCGPADITLPPVEHAICCFEGGCYDHEGGLCGGTEVWCGKGVSNDDGTVTCLDGE